MSTILKLREKADTVCCSLSQSLDLCELICKDYDFVNISNEKKLDIYKRSNVLIGILLSRLFEEQKMLEEVVSEMYKIK